MTTVDSKTRHLKISATWLCDQIIMLEGLHHYATASGNKYSMRYAKGGIFFVDDTSVDSTLCWVKEDFIRYLRLPLNITNGRLYVNFMKHVCNSDVNAYGARIDFFDVVHVID